MLECVDCPCYASLLQGYLLTMNRRDACSTASIQERQFSALAAAGRHPTEAGEAEHQAEGTGLGDCLKGKKRHIGD